MRSLDETPEEMFKDVIEDFDDGSIDETQPITPIGQLPPKPDVKFILSTLESPIWPNAIILMTG